MITKHTHLILAISDLDYDTENLYAKMTLYMETLRNCLNRSYYLQLSLIYTLHEPQVPD